MADSVSWVTMGDTEETEDTPVEDEPMKMGRIGGRGMQLTRAQRAMIRIMNDHGMPLAAIQESLDCQRATVIATINQTRKRKDDVSKDYEAVQNYVGFVKQFPPETGGLPTFTPQKVSKLAPIRRRKVTPEDDREFTARSRTRSKLRVSKKPIRRTRDRPYGSSEDNKTSMSQEESTSRPTPTMNVPEPPADSNNAEAVRQFLSGLPLDISILQGALSDLFLDTKEKLFKFAQYPEPDLKEMFRVGIPGIKETQVFVLVKALKEHAETRS